MKIYIVKLNGVKGHPYRRIEAPSPEAAVSLALRTYRVAYSAQFVKEDPRQLKSEALRWQQ